MVLTLYYHKKNIFMAQYYKTAFTAKQNRIKYAEYREQNTEDGESAAPKQRGLTKNGTGYIIKV